MLLQLAGLQKTIFKMVKDEYKAKFFGQKMQILLKFGIIVEFLQQGQIYS